MANNNNNNNPGLELEITELRLGLPGEKKRVFSEVEKKGNDSNVGATSAKNVAVAVAVGWPPVCSYRKRSIGSEKECVEASNNKRLVKVSMDGVPFLRKIGVNGFHEYSHFVASLENLFACSGLKNALEDTENCEYVLIYEDKDGDWLLVGDVPWSMFVESCKRLRIMKSEDAKGFELQCKKQCRG